MKELAEKVAVITGAGSGFGRELAIECTANGMKLVLADVNQQGLEGTLDLLTNQAEVVSKLCDVSLPDNVELLADIAYTKFGAVHLLFNNAGVASTGLSWQSSTDEWRRLLDINLMGVVHGIQAFVPRMLSSGQAAHIINTASLAGLSSVPGSSIYCASKHAVVTLSECLHHELTQQKANINVSVLCPAFVPTAIAGSATDNDDSPYAKQLQRAVEAGRLSAEDIARITLEGVRNGDFYILPHGAARKSVAMRAEDIIEGKLPRDPAAGMFSHITENN